jgi:cell division protein FtsB
MGGVNRTDSYIARASPAVAVDPLLGSRFVKFKQLLERHQSRLMIIPWVLLAIVFLTGLLGNQGVIRLYQLRQERHKLEAAIQAQKDINIKLRRDVYYLRNDPHYLEKLAREEMGLVKEGELVYQFRD